MTDPLTDETIDQPMGRAQLTRSRLARLLVVFPRELSAIVTLDLGETTLGRQPGPRGHTLAHSTVSRRHASVRWSSAKTRYELCDHGSRNGSRADGHLVGLDDGPRPLHSGSVIRVGDVLLVLEVDERLTAEDPPEVSPEAIFGRSAMVQRLRADIFSAAADPSPVLIVGATGTGKENVARELHRLSGRKGPLIPLNCAALSPQLVESQLFGHRRGAFTGAQTDHDGVFRAANGGTVFLDEVGELPLALQPKLLRVLQEGEVQPVGASQPQKVDVRVVAATLRDLATLAEQKEFRLDLYARLSPWEISVPALTERRADLLVWLERLHRIWHEERGRPLVPLQLEADHAEQLLLDQWPDNLRGIERLVHRICSRPQVPLDEWLNIPSRTSPPGAPLAGQQPDTPSTAPGRASSAGMSGRPTSPGTGPAGIQPRQRPTKEQLMLILAEHAGSVRATAKQLGRDRRQIYRWMDLYGLRETPDDK